MLMNMFMEKQPIILINIAELRDIIERADNIHGQQVQLLLAAKTLKTLKSTTIFGQQIMKRSCAKKK